MGPIAPGSHVVCHVLDLAVRDSSTAATILEANQSASLTAKLHAIREAVMEKQQELQHEPPQQPQQQDHHQQQGQQQQQEQQIVCDWVPPSSVHGLLHKTKGSARATTGALPVASTHPAQHSPQFKQQQEQLVRRMRELPSASNWATNSCHAAVLKVCVGVCVCGCGWVSVCV